MNNVAMLALEAPGQHAQHTEDNRIGHAMKMLSVRKGKGRLPGNIARLEDAS